MAIDSQQVAAVRSIILEVIDKEYSSTALASADQALSETLGSSKEGRAAHPELMNCLNNRHGKRAMKLAGRRAGLFTGRERIMLAGLMGSILALVGAVPGLMLLPQSAGIAAPVLCENYPTDAPRRSALTPPSRDVEKTNDLLASDPFQCPTTTAETQSLSVFNVSIMLFIIYWMPFTLLSYVVMLFWIHRKKTVTT